MLILAQALLLDACIKIIGHQKLSPYVIAQVLTIYYFFYGCYTEELKSTRVSGLDHCATYHYS
jgi:hypothetical protein